MEIPPGDGVLSSKWLSQVLTASQSWSHGSVRVTSAEQIGLDYGLSGSIHRVTAETERGGSVSFVVKQERAGAVERELLFRLERGHSVTDDIPALLGSASDARTDRGVLLLEDVTPADQGDVLHGCTPEESEAVVRVLARVHDAAWSPGDVPERLPRWEPRPMERAVWHERVTRAGERFPAILTQERRAQIHDLPERVADARDRLRHAPVSWIHVDAHLDNVLFRPDGRAVLLDWCNAAIGPPAFDLARFLTDGAQPSDAPRLLAAYTDELGTAGESRVEVVDLEVSCALALLPILQGAVGWAGRETSETTGRQGALCESLLRNSCDWALGPRPSDNA